MRTILRNLALAPALAAALWLTASAVAQAHGPTGTLSEPAYQEMRRLARQLDEQALHANDQAQHGQYRIYRRDAGFTRAVSTFARRARRFDERMATYRSEPWQVDDELRLLLQSARDVQARVQRSRYVDDHTVADWDETVRVLSRMVRLFQADVNRSGRFEYDTGSQRPAYRDDYGEAPPPAYREAPPPAYGETRPRGAYRYPRERLATLAHELEDRATRAHELAERLAVNNGPRQQEFLEAIHHFNDQAAEFHGRVESGWSDPMQIREEVNHLLDDARQADEGMRRTNVFPEVWQEWRGTMRLLQQILDLVGS